MPSSEFRPGVDADAIPECDLDDDELAALLGSKDLDEASMTVLREKVRVAEQAAGVGGAEHTCIGPPAPAPAQPPGG